MDDELMCEIRRRPHRAGSLIEADVPSRGLADTGFELGALTKAIETTQKRVESHNYEIRKSVLKFDDVMNQNARDNLRLSVRQVLRGADFIRKIAQDDVTKPFCRLLISKFCPEKQKRGCLGLRRIGLTQFFRMFGINGDAISVITAETTRTAEC